MKKNALKTLAGFRDYLPQEALLKEKLLQKLRLVFQSFGFSTIETPHLEYAAVLVDNIDDDTETNKQIYRFLDHGKREVALRYDHTVPLARFVSQYRYELTLPFKRYVLGNVFRGESPQTGRFREFTQCDFDFIGVEQVTADAEIIQVIYHALKALGIDDFAIRINHRRLLDALMVKFGCLQQKDLLLQITDKLEKKGAPAILQELTAAKIFSSAEAKNWIDLVSSDISDLPALESFIFKKIGVSDDLKMIYQDFSRVFGILEASSIPKSHYRADLKIARGLQYYTGMVYETFLKDNSALGSICSGGRYDDLTARFSPAKLPGAGASIGLDRLLSIFKNGNFPLLLSNQQHLLIALLDESVAGFAYSLAALVRAENINVEVYPKAVKLGKQFQYAQKKGFMFLLACGENEKAGSELILADLKSGEKTKLADVSELLASLNKQINRD